MSLILLFLLFIFDCSYAVAQRAGIPSGPAITSAPAATPGLDDRFQNNGIVIGSSTTAWIGINNPSQYLSIPPIATYTSYLSENEGTTTWVGSNSDWLGSDGALQGLEASIDEESSELTVLFSPRVLETFEDIASSACHASVVKRQESCAANFVESLPDAQSLNVNGDTLPELEELLGNAEFEGVMESLMITSENLNQILATATSRAARRYYLIALLALNFWRLYENIPYLVAYRYGERPSEPSPTSTERDCPTGRDVLLCYEETCGGDLEERCVHADNFGCSCLPLATVTYTYPYDPWIEDGQQRVLSYWENNNDGQIIDAPTLTARPSCTTFLDRWDERPGSCLMVLNPTPTNGRDCQPSTTEGQLCTVLDAALPTSSVTCEDPWTRGEGEMYESSIDLQGAEAAIWSICEDDSLVVDPEPAPIHDFLEGSTGRGSLFHQYVDEERFGRIMFTLQVGWAEDQTRCAASRRFRLSDDQERCREALLTTINGCDTDTTSRKYGGTYHEWSLDYGCLQWDFGVQTAFQTE